MPLLELHRIGKPTQHVTEGIDRQPDQHLAPGGAIVMQEHALALLPGFQAKGYEIALRAVDPSGLDLGLEQDVAGIDIGDAHAPEMAGVREHHPTTVVEIEPQPARTLVGRNFGGLGGARALFLADWRGQHRRRGSRNRRALRMRRKRSRLKPSGRRALDCKRHVRSRRYCCVRGGRITAARSRASAS